MKKGYLLMTKKENHMTFTGEYYHVFNRGNQKQKIFFEDENYEFFICRLEKYLKECGPGLIAYCLMPNHYHLLLQEEVDKGIPKLMHKLQTSYAKAINRRYYKVGHLFQGSYKKVNVQTNTQFLHLSGYIHLNPVKTNLVICPEDWNFSSYQDYIGLRDNGMVKKEILLSCFSSVSEYQNFVVDGVKEIHLQGLTFDD